MEQYYLTFRSITRAQLALQDLQTAGIPAVLQRTPRALATEGCGYALRLRGTDAAAAERTLVNSPVQHRVWYRDGQFREVRGDLS